jgi:hypothetical protein
LRRPLLARDALLLVLVGALWAVCFGLHVKELLRGSLAWVTVTVAASSEPDGYPVVSGTWPGGEKDAPGLVLGDRVLRVGGADLAGGGPFSFVAAAYQYGGSPVPVEISRNGRREIVSMALRPVGASWRLPILSLGFALPGFLVLWRRSGSIAARAAFLGCVCFSLQWTFFFGGPPAQTYFWIAVFGISAIGLYPLMLQAVLAIPEDAAATPTRPTWTWAFALYAASAFSWVFGFPFSSERGVRVSAALNALAPLFVLGLITRSYLRSGPIGRRQLRWIVYGLYVGALPVAIGSFVSTAAPRWWWLHGVLMSSVVLVPVCFLVAIVRFNFLDIDRLITATLSYSILLVLFVVGAAALVPVAGWLATSLIGVPRAAADLTMSILLAGAVIPAHRRLRPRIDRTLFAERYAVEQGVDELIEELAGCETPAELHELTGATLDRLLRPEHCVIYERIGRDFQPRFVTPRAAATALAGGDPLIELLRRTHSPLSAEGAGRKPQGEPRIRAAMASAGAAAVVGLRGGDTIGGLLCLGRKRSGDVYTSTDLDLLRRVGDALATRLAQCSVAA